MLKFTLSIAQFNYYTYLCITIKNKTVMAKGIKCKLTLHAYCREIEGGQFESIKKAKEWIRDCWARPYTLKRL